MFSGDVGLKAGFIDGRSWRSLELLAAGEWGSLETETGRLNLERAAAQALTTLRAALLVVGECELARAGERVILDAKRVWTLDDDERLEILVLAGAPVAVMCKVLGRERDEIAARLERLPVAWDPDRNAWDLSRVAGPPPHTQRRRRRGA